MAPPRLDTSHFGTPGSAVTPMYHPLATPTSQTHDEQTRTSVKRARPDDLHIHTPGLTQLEHTGLGGMQHVALGHAYAAHAAVSAGHTPPTHHHHRLPDSEPSAKLIRREDAGGAPSVVGQEGMPSPAPRPKGPKLKFTPEDDQLLIELKEQKNLTWKQIADFFPGRSSGTLQVRYCTKLKAKTKQWSDEMDHKLRTVLEDYENEKWRIVASKLGTGFTPAACRERAEELWADAHAVFGATSSSPPRPLSVGEPSSSMYSHHHH